MVSEKQARFWRRVSTGAIALAVLSLVLAFVAGPGFRFGAWKLSTAFDLLRAAFFIAGGLGAVAFLGLLIAASGAHRRAAVKLGIAAVLCGGVVLVLMEMRSDARNIVPIHDVTTDVEEPPTFAVLPERLYDPLIVPDRGRQDLANVDPKVRWRIYHEEAYGDLAPLVVDLPLTEAVDAAERAARELGWEIAATDIEGGRLEATDTTFWFGFKDDVVVRVRPVDENSSRIDVRSVSRIGVSDLGANAARVRRFLTEVQQIAEARS